MKWPPKTDDTSDLDKVANVISAFQAIDHTLQVSTALVLLTVAKHQDREGGLSTGDIANLIGSSSAVGSRNTYYWAEGNSQMPRGGHEFLTVKIDPANRRRRLVQLTPKGDHMVKRLLGAVA